MSFRFADWLRAFRIKTSSHRRTSSVGRHYSFRPMIEELEERRLLSSVSLDLQLTALPGTAPIVPGVAPPLSNSLQLEKTFDKTITVSDNPGSASASASGSTTTNGFGGTAIANGTSTGSASASPPNQVGQPFSGSISLNKTDQGISGSWVETSAETLMTFSGPGTVTLKYSTDIAADEGLTATDPTADYSQWSLSVKNGGVTSQVFLTGNGTQTFQLKSSNGGDTITIQAPEPSASIDLENPINPWGYPGRFDGSATGTFQWTYLPNSPVWTGDGSNDLWSNGQNWLSEVAPQAGDDLLFPSNAHQQTNVNDLGFTFKSVTVQGGDYKISGQPLTTTGTLDFQQGSTELDCSTTTGGPTTVEAGASLSIGDGATLNVLSSDPFTVNGNFSLLANSNCNIAGDASVASGATLDAAASSSCSFAANSNVSLLGKATFDDGSNLTLNLNSSLDVGAGGALDTSGTATFLGNTTMASGSSLTAGADSKTVIDGAFNTGGKVQLDKGSTLTYKANARVEVKASGTVNSAGTTTANVGSVETLDAGATLTQQSGSNAYLYGTCNNAGTCQIAAGASVYQYSGSQYNLSGKYNINGGDLTLEASANLANGAKLFLDKTGSVLETGGQVTIGHDDTLFGTGGAVKVSGGVFDDQGKVSGLVSITDGEAITVATGATLDVSGSLTEDAGGHLVVFGTVTIERGASLNDFTKITIEPGGVLDVLGAISVSQAGSLDIFGKVIVANGAKHSLVGTVTVERGGVYELPNTVSGNPPSPAPVPTSPSSGGGNPGASQSSTNSTQTREFMDSLLVAIGFESNNIALLMFGLDDLRSLLNSLPGSDRGPIQNAFTQDFVIEAYLLGNVGLPSSFPLLGSIGF